MEGGRWELGDRGASGLSFETERVLSSHRQVGGGGRDGGLWMMGAEAAG